MTEHADSDLLQVAPPHANLPDIKIAISNAVCRDDKITAVLWSMSVMQLFGDGGGGGSGYVGACGRCCEARRLLENAGRANLVFVLLSV